MRLLFTGYAPVHFVCFRRLYSKLTTLPGLQLFVAGGLRTKTDDGTVYDPAGLYKRFDVPDEQILSMEQIKNEDFDVVLAANTKLIEPRSAGLRVQLFHGLSFRNVAVRKPKSPCDQYFLIGPYMRRKFAEAGLMHEDDGRGISIGFPKTDPLLNGEMHRDEVLRHFKLDGSRPVIGYAPTGQKYNSLETMGEEVIQRLKATGRFDILIKPHDHPKRDIDWFTRLAPLEDEHTRVVRDADVMPLLFASDLLITDASSVANEYSLLDRPIVYLDVPKLLLKAMEKNPGMDLVTWGRRAGRLVHTPDKVVAAVEESLGDPKGYAPIRRAMAQDLFYNPGHATEAATNWLQQRLGYQA
ncbi:MAG: hypothetical protein QOF48_1748 [Verrucomicrobiota bacterium]|jgi:hypothetical protein